MLSTVLVPCYRNCWCPYVCMWKCIICHSLDGFIYYYGFTYYFCLMLKFVVNLLPTMQVQENCFPFIVIIVCAGVWSLHAHTYFRFTIYCFLCSVVMVGWTMTWTFVTHGSIYVFVATSNSVLYGVVVTDGGSGIWCRVPLSQERQGQVWDLGYCRLGKVCCRTLSLLLSGYLCTGCTLFCRRDGFAFVIYLYRYFKSSLFYFSPRFRVSTQFHKWVTWLVSNVSFEFAACF